MLDPSPRIDDVFCHAALNFAARGETFEAHVEDVAIFDGRTAELPGWDECGFELLSHRSAVSGWDDDELIAVHHAEMETLARQLTGADLALVSNHIKRGPEHEERHQDLGPIAFVHSDFARGYESLVRDSYLEPDPGRPGPIRALERNGVTAEAVAAASRLVILQFWRNTGPAKMDYPLAWCDARSVRPQDTRPIPVTDYAGSGANFEALAVLGPTAPDQYRWYAFPEMRIDEVVAFRTYDSALVEQDLTWFTPHTAFSDPDVAIGRPARSSIELRAICLFE